MKLAYTITEFCAESGLGRTFTYQRIAAGDLIRIKAGRRSLITAASAHDYIASLVRENSK